MKPYVQVGTAAIAVALGPPAISWGQNEEKRETKRKAAVVLPAPACNCKGSRIWGLVVQGTERKFTVPVTKDHGTRLRGADKGHLNFSTNQDPRKLGFDVKRIAANELEITPLANTRSNTTFTVTAQGRTAQELEYAALVTLKVDNDASRAPMVAQVIHESEQLLELQRQKEARKAKEQQREAELAQERKRGRREGRAEERRASEQRRLTRESQQLIEETNEEATAHRIRLQPIYEARSDGERTFEILESRWDSSGKRILAQFKARSSYARPFHITTVSAVTKGAQGAEAAVDATITTVDRVSTVDSSVIATIKPGQEVHGVIALSPPSGVALKRFIHRIVLIDARTQQTLAVRLRGWRIQRVPLVATRRDEWLAEVAAREAREAQAVQLIVSPGAYAGFLWLPNGLEGDGRERKPATFVGAGVRVTKGVSELLAFEAEVSGGNTGEATFTVEGEELRRSSTFGRVRVGAALRFGYEGVIPTARAGIGLQGIGYNSETTGTKPDDAIEFSGLLGFFGGGVDYRFSEHVIGGVGFSLVAAEEIQAFEAGVRLGYGWNPGASAQR